MQREKEEFESELGDVTVGLSKISRERSMSETWDKIMEEFSEEVLVDTVRFSELEDIDFDQGPMFPCIRLKIDGDWKRMFFAEGDDAEDCFRRLVYMWSSYKQNNQ